MTREQMIDAAVVGSTDIQIRRQIAAYAKVFGLPGLDDDSKYGPEIDEIRAEFRIIENADRIARRVNHLIALSR